ncbi:MAG: glycosyltransferase [Flammeovirgaceae bacterium]|nr:glycosyltransferase [Flammeovirgaceae bacterium]
MSAPLVTVICICYNHARFVEATLDSVINQTYKDIELIVIDDSSTDGSSKIIKRWIANHPETTLFYLMCLILGIAKLLIKRLKFQRVNILLIWPRMICCSPTGLKLV